MEPAADGFFRRIDRDVCRLPPGAGRDRRNSGTADSCRRDRHDVSFVRNCFCDDIDGRHAHPLVYVLAIRRLVGDYREAAVALASRCRLLGTIALAAHARSLNLIDAGRTRRFRSWGRGRACAVGGFYCGEFAGGKFGGVEWLGWLCRTRRATSRSAFAGK